jgi:hypothetical protein
VVHAEIPHRVGASHAGNQRHKQQDSLCHLLVIRWQARDWIGY